MTTELVKAPSTELVSEINREHEAVLVSGRNMIEHAIRAGELLVSVRESLAHGQWTPWLKDNFAASEWTAQAYIRLAREEGANPGSITGASGIGAALKSIARSKKELPAPSVDPGSVGGQLITSARSALRGSDSEELIVDAVVVEDPPPGVDERRWFSTLAHVDSARRCLSEATLEHLDAEASAGALKEASVECRRAAVELEQLAVARRRAG